MTRPDLDRLIGGAYAAWLLLVVLTRPIHRRI